MFTTESQVTHLKPATVLGCVQRVEEEHWARGDVMVGLSDPLPHLAGTTLDLGSLLLGESSSMRKIHNYFSQLESRKCCLHLACRRSTFNSMRVVQSSWGADDGSAKTSLVSAETEHLENKELRAFKHAYLCAVYPVLAAPAPPSPVSPSPAPPSPFSPSCVPQDSNCSQSSHRAIFHIPPLGALPSTSGAGPGLGQVSSPKSEATRSGSPFSSRPLTPYSLHDSGVEESEEAALIPMESICEQLQRAFCLSRRMFRQYEEVIVKTYAKKSSQRLLAEELCGQLSVLESDSHPFYSTNKFITQNGYSLWQKQERSHISELLNKFWHQSLPFPRDSQDLIAELYSVHEDYHILLRKLLSYEGRFRSESENVASVTVYTPLSSASWRLLLEFALRYGIGELYRKVLYLDCISSDFCPSVGYLSHVITVLSSIQQLLPANKTAVLMTKVELEILQGTLRTLRAQSCKALSQMKFLFPCNRPPEGIDLLLSVLQLSLKLMSYLCPSSQNSFESCLKAIVQGMFKPCYEMFRTVAIGDLGQGRNATLDPRLLNILIQDIREDVSDYKNHFESTFQRYFSISKMAASTFYQLLMNDVHALTETDPRHKPLVEIDLRMLALGYRLKQLDSDWKMYITPQQQTWRAAFQGSLTQWTSALRVHLQNLVLEGLAGDAYTSSQLDLPAPVGEYQSPSSPGSSSKCSRSLSTMSISPSVNSAFSSVVSSLRSTPGVNPAPELDVPSAHYEAIQESNLEQQPPEACTADGPVEEKESKKFKTQFDSRSLNLEEEGASVVRFSAFRQYSLPEKLDQGRCDVQFDRNQHVKRQSNGEKCVSSSEQVLNCDGGLLNEEISALSDNARTLAPSSPVGIPSITPSEEEENDAEKSLDGEESADEEFQFPPLRVVSQKPQSDAESFPSLAQPVFTRSSSPGCVQAPTTQATAHRYLLRADVPHSVSSRASSVVDHVTERNDFMDSMASDVSFPPPPAAPPESRQAMLPISHSAVDLVIILQRLCGFSHSLVSMMIDESSFLTPAHNTQHTSQNPGVGVNDLEAGAEAGDLQSHQELTRKCSSDVEMVLTGGAGMVPPSLSVSDTDPGSNDPLAHERDTPSHVLQGDSGACPGAESARPSAHTLSGHKLKLSLHLRLLKSMCNILVVYTGNMLCMDLCGTSRVEAKKLVGCKLLEFLESQQLGGLVWGCRHQLEVSTDCMYYHKRRSRLLSDRYEPVTRHMCTRINNVAACLHFLEHYHQQLLKALNIVVGSSSSSSSEEEGEEGDAGDGMELSFSSDDGVDSAFDATGTQNNTGASEEFVYVSHSTDQPEVDSLSGSLYGEEDQVVRRWTYQSQQALDGAREHIMSVLTALCRLLAFRLNLFVGDGLPLLLQLKQPEASLPSCLAPITTFLQRYLDSLSTWLYQHCFTRVLHNLWIFMVQDIEKQTDLLRLSGTAANSQAHTWMMVVSFLMKFMNNNGKGIKKDLLLSQANEAIFKLQLYTLSTWHLIALFQSLREYYTEGDHLSLEENQSRSPPAVVHRIHRELQALRKCFSGAELVHWIIKNKDALPADLSLPPGPVDREVAISISQLLVDRQFILDTDSDCSTGSHSPVSITGMDAMSPYPQLSVHSHAFSDYEYDDRRSSALRSHVFSDYDYDNRHSSAPRSGSHSSDSSTRENSEVEVLVHCDEDRTPTGEVVADNRDPVLDSSSHDTTLRRRSSPPFPLNATDGLPAPPLPSQSPPALATSFSQSLSISDFRPLALQAERRLRQRTRDSGSGDSLFDTERRLTPFSNLNEQTLTRGTRFVPSSRKFYVVQQNLVPAGLASPEQTDPRSAGGLTEGEREFLKLKSSPESRELLEQCVVHKVGPLSILAIVAARRKTDSTSKNFMKKLPKHLLDKVNNLLDEPGMDCRSS